MTWKRVPTITLRDDQLPLVLVGLPGAGKTTQARLLAQALGVQVTDTDAEIRRRARMTIPEIFAAEGEECFPGRGSGTTSREPRPAARSHGHLPVRLPEYCGQARGGRDRAAGHGPGRGLRPDPRGTAAQ